MLERLLFLRTRVTGLGVLMVLLLSDWLLLLVGGVKECLLNRACGLET